MHSHTFIAAAGGTGGSISPLLSLLEMFPDDRVVWVGTRGHWGKEQEFVRGALNPNRSLHFRTIASGKLRRYADLRNLFDPFFILVGFFQSLLLLLQEKPCAVLTAGSYVAVPVAWAAWVLRTPVVLYQQDVIVGLANRLMLPTASLVLSVRPGDDNKFKKSKLLITNYQLPITVVGAFIRNQVTSGSVESAEQYFCLEKELPTLLVLGGGTGSGFLNQLITGTLPALTQFSQIIHVTGSRTQSLEPRTYNLQPRYHPRQFLGPELADAYAAADLVVTRAGMGVLTELAVNTKAAVVIPMPETHQEANAKLIHEHDAGVVVAQKKISPDHFVAMIEALIKTPKRRTMLSQNLATLFPRAKKEHVVAAIEGVIR